MVGERKPKRKRAVARRKTAAMKIFLSHSHLDRAIADAVAELLRDLFGEWVRVEHSSDQTTGGGIPPGEQWLPWVTKRIRGADKTFVLLTPNSMRKPWVLWESGAAAGVALATKKSSPVVPIAFGIANADIPSPFSSTQTVQGDIIGLRGVDRLLRELNRELKSPLSDRAFTRTRLRGFVAKVTEAVRESTPVESLLASVPPSFKATKLGGLWVTCYEFQSGAKNLCHADIAVLTPEADGRVTVRNRIPVPRTEGHINPFLNEIEAELANRHLIGHWKNVSDTRYFGAIHLAVLTEESVMEGYYTCLSSDVAVGCGFWKWVRIDSATIAGVDLSKATLREPREIKRLLAAHRSSDGPLALRDVVGPA